MRTKARFPEIPEKEGHYESFYLKLTQPGGGRGAWIRHTVHKRPGEQASCALWFVLFDASAAGPKATKRQNDALAQKYQIQGYPTIIVLSSGGTRKGELGYMPGGPDAFIKALEKAR